MKHDGYLTIRDLPTDERPRERLQKFGAEALKTSELLAILFRTGNRRCSALGLAEGLLGKFGNLRKLAKADLEELCQVDGIGPAKAVEIKAAFELGKRLAVFTEDEKPSIRSPQDVVNLLMSEMKNLDREHFRVLLLDSKNQVLRIDTVSVGSLNTSIVHPRECFRPAITAGCAAVIVAHNHPSGDVSPSKEDMEVTKRLVEAGEILGIKVLDHVVLGDGKYLSFKEEQML